MASCTRWLWRYPVPAFPNSFGWTFNVVQFSGGEVTTFIEPVLYGQISVSLLVLHFINGAFEF
ncbi:hypothetical protein, partial [Endozoicomonas numazuensis]|uniref:hypothetical protein n=1 Tax=Endozoicomonas numazuensis TaxID=1137799 RepID=UPI001F3ECFAC